MSSLDFTVYGYLKEELINTDESAEVKYLKANCPNLMGFYQMMEFLFVEEDKSLEEKQSELRQQFFARNRIRFVKENDRPPNVQQNVQDNS